jgi:hypothetical protein
MRVVELDVVPDWLIRRGIRLLLRIRLLSVSAGVRAVVSARWCARWCERAGVSARRWQSWRRPPRPFVAMI